MFDLGLDDLAVSDEIVAVGAVLVPRQEDLGAVRPGDLPHRLRRGRLLPRLAREEDLSANSAPGIMWRARASSAPA